MITAGLIIAAGFFGMGFGTIIGGMQAGRRINDEQAMAEHWKKQFHRGVRDLAQVCEERDLLRHKVRSMQPLYDLGLRRKAAIEKASAKARNDRAA